MLVVVTNEFVSKINSQSICSCLCKSTTIIRLNRCTSHTINEKIIPGPVMANFEISGGLIEQKFTMQCNPINDKTSQVFILYKN